MPAQNAPQGFSGSQHHINQWQNDLYSRQPQVRVPQQTNTGARSSQDQFLGINNNPPAAGGGLTSVWEQLIGGGNLLGGNTNQAGTGLPAGTGGGASGGSVQSSAITPGPIYNNQQTQEATNSAVAQQHVGANLPWLTNQATGQGMSVRSPAAMTRALPSYAGALAGGATAGVMTPLEMDTANASHILSGQSALAGSNIDYNRIGEMLNAGERGSSIRQSGALLELFQRLIG